MISSTLAQKLSELDDHHAFDNWHQCRQWAIQLVGSLPLTPKQASWVAMAQDYLAGQVPSDTLTRARMAAWETIKGIDCDFSRQDVNQTRAVIALLFPDNSDLGDPFDYIGQVIEFYLDAGGIAGYVDGLLEAYFPTSNTPSSI